MQCNCLSSVGSLFHFAKLILIVFTSCFLDTRCLCCYTIKNDISPCNQFKSSMRQVDGDWIWTVLDVFSPNFQRWCTLGQGQTFQVLGTEGQSSRSQWGPTCWKIHVLALLVWYLENYWTEFCQTSIDAFWTRMNASILGVKRSKFKVAARPRAQQADTYWAWSCASNSNL